MEYDAVMKNEEALYTLMEKDLQSTNVKSKALNIILNTLCVKKGCETRDYIVK